MMADWKEYLLEIYYTPHHASSFGGVEKLYQTAVRDGRKDVTRTRIKQFLQEQETYSVHRPVNSKFKRNKVMVTGIDDQWQMDLMSMMSYAKYNNKINHILLIIDVFSKTVWLRALKNKTGAEVRGALEDIFQEGRKPSRIQSDKGKEFLAKTVLDYLKAQGIKHFTSQNEVKASIAERAIKTIRSKIQHYMTSKQTFKYVHLLQDFAKSYNSTVHSSIKMTPEDVSEENATQVWMNLYWPKEKSKRPHFKHNVGDYVRLSYLRRTFQREYDQRWTGEIFKVSRRYSRGGLPIYRIKDFNGMDIDGTFYQSELQKVTIKDDQLWKVDKILKQRRRNNKTEYFVRWLHWPKSFDSWVDAKDIVDI